MSSPPNLPAIAKADWQQKIFAPSPRRVDLLSLKPNWDCRTIRLRIHRNMPFEFVASALPSFLAYADLFANLVISDYDDALNLHIEGPADCELIWLDYGRYENRADVEAFASWLLGRLQALRAVSTAPILMADGEGASPALNQKLQELTARIPGCRIFPRQGLQTRLNDRWFDDRVKDISASRMSDAATIAAAQLLGLVWLPGAVGVGLKALALDLDETLYAGVLGEDGVEGVRLTEAHRALQQKVLTLKQQGFFLALLSRNDPADVEKLFATRTDFPLRWTDFSARSISWGDKAEGLSEIAAQLRIHPDAVLILDDNLGEIGRIAQHHPKSPILYAADPAGTAQALDLFPRLLRWHQDRTDALRADDLKAAKARTTALKNAQDPLDYMRSLDLKLHFWLDPQSLLSRLADLARKTNQFALSLARFNEAEVARRLSDARYATIAASLSDKLSDSGVIAALFCSKDSDCLLVDEICVSCRALGRGVEDLIMATALVRASEKLGTKKIAFAYGRGPRNDPARRWLEAFAEVPLANDSGRIEIDGQELSLKLSSLPVRISWDDK